MLQTIWRAAIAVLVAAELRPLSPPFAVDADILEEIHLDKVHRHECGDHRAIASTVLGCWPLEPGDGPDRDAEYHDRTCSNVTARGKHCRSGFPFFRFSMPEGAHFVNCLTFCTTKGLDLAGAVTMPGRGFECRCGASRSNAMAWNRDEAPEDLLLAWQHRLSKKASKEDCPIVVLRFHGHMEHGSIPVTLLNIQLDERQYMLDIIGASRLENFEEDPSKMETLHLEKFLKTDDLEKLPSPKKPGEVASALLQMEMMCSDLPDPDIHILGQQASCPDLKSLCQRDDIVGQRIQSSCPYTCDLCPKGMKEGEWSKCGEELCSSGASWPTLDEPSGMFEINYIFDANVDFVRRDTFHRAVHAWESGTCVRFKEGGDKPRIRVVVKDPRFCWSSHGYPGADGEAKINLGSCNSFSHLGNMIHEVGHALGMSHEHKRPDAFGKIYLPPPVDEVRGPHLKIHWDNIPKGMRSQYTPDPMAYTGSSSAGYSDYDYDSIMHYGRQFNPGNGGFNFDTVLPSFNSLVGQRQKPSDGDIRQLRDMYQCDSAKKNARSTSSSVAKTLSDTANQVWGFFGFEQTSISRWNAGIWSSCRKAEDKTCYRRRSVHCVDLDGEPLKPAHCRPNSKPVSRESCSCSFACEDRQHTGVRRLGHRLSCLQLRSLCEDSLLGRHVRAVCPVTCEVCSTRRNHRRGCEDMWPSSLVLNLTTGEDLTCAQLKSARKCDALDVAQRCPKSCGLCDAVDKCEDSQTFRDSKNRSCTRYLGFQCSVKVAEACPASCGFCH